MKSILLVLCTIGLGILILRSERTPWRLVRATDLQRSSATSPGTIGRRVFVPVTSGADHSGDWMHDPNYRSALERNTVAGRPETVVARDLNTPTPTPARPRP